MHSWKDTLDYSANTMESALQYERLLNVGAAPGPPAPKGPRSSQTEGDAGAELGGGSAALPMCPVSPVWAPPIQSCPPATPRGPKTEMGLWSHRETFRSPSCLLLCVGVGGAQSSSFRKFS